MNIFRGGGKSIQQQHVRPNVTGEEGHDAAFKMEMFALTPGVTIIRECQCQHYQVPGLSRYHVSSANHSQELRLWTNQNWDKANTELLKSLNILHKILRFVMHHRLTFTTTQIEPISKKRICDLLNLWRLSWHKYWIDLYFKSITNPLLTTNKVSRFHSHNWVFGSVGNLG